MSPKFGSLLCPPKFGSALAGTSSFRVDISDAGGATQIWQPPNGPSPRPEQRDPAETARLAAIFSDQAAESKAEAIEEALADEAMGGGEGGDDDDDRVGGGGADFDDDGGEGAGGSESRPTSPLADPTPPPEDADEADEADEAGSVADDIAVPAAPPAMPPPAPPPSPPPPYTPSDDGVSLLAYTPSHEESLGVRDSAPAYTPSAAGDDEWEWPHAPSGEDAEAESMVAEATGQLSSAGEPPTSLPPSPPGEDAAGGTADDEEAAAAAPAVAAGAGPASGGDAGEYLCESADEDFGGEWAYRDLRQNQWQQVWHGCVMVLSQLAHGERGVLPQCGLRMPCGHNCARIVHVKGGTLECVCPRCGNATDLAEGEVKRWRSLREALKLRGDGTINPLTRSESIQKEDAETGAPDAKADAKAAAAEAAADMAPPKPAPKTYYVSNFSGAVKPNLNMVGYWSMPPKHRATSLRDARNILGKFASGGGASGESVKQFDAFALHSESASAAPEAEAAAANEPRSRLASPAFDPRVERLVERVASAAAASRTTEADALNAGWRKCTSKSNGREFWFHRETGRKEWTIDKLGLSAGGPVEPEPDHRHAPAKSGHGSHQSGGGSSSGAHDGGSSSGAQGSVRGAGSKRIPKPEWKAYFSEKRQKSFYKNTSTGETTWTKPDGFVE